MQHMVIKLALLKLPHYCWFYLYDLFSILLFYSLNLNSWIIMKIIQGLILLDLLFCILKIYQVIDLLIKVIKNWLFVYVIILFYIVYFFCHFYQSIYTQYHFCTQPQDCFQQSPCSQFNLKQYTVSHQLQLYQCLTTLNNKQKQEMGSW